MISLKNGLAIAKQSTNDTVIRELQKEYDSLDAKLDRIENKINDIGDKK